MDRKWRGGESACALFAWWLSLGVATAGLPLADGSRPSVGYEGARFDETVILCQEEYFRPKCGRNQLLYVEHAQYGRMRLSRCVNRDFGYVGCSRNVLPIVEARCSGRRSCSLKVLDETFPVDPCHIDLRSYLEIRYRCVDVHLPKPNCDSATLITDASGYLASLVTMETGCGGTEAPWVLRAQPGQRLNITLFDFGGHVTGNETLTPTKGADGSTNLCKVYATIKEAKGSRRNTICGGNDRIRLAYVSLGNNVEIRVYGNRGEKNHAHFFLHYQVIGCADPEPPSGGWVKRNEQVALLGCHDNADTWQWTCSGTTWVGEQKNCTPAQLLTSSDDVNEGGIPLGLSIVIVVILALVVGATILIIGLVCLRRPNQGQGRADDRKRDTSSSIPLRDMNGDVTVDDKSAVVCSIRNAQTTTIIHRLKDDKEGGATENDYATTRLLTSSVLDPSVSGSEYGEYARRSKCPPDPYYMSRLECRRSDAEQPPDLTRPDRSGTAGGASGDAVIVDLGSTYDPEALQIGAGRAHPLDRSCACGQPITEYVYHQGACCRHCGGLIQNEPDCHDRFRDACSVHALGHVTHGKEGAADPNCVICSLPRNKAVKPSS